MRVSKADVIAAVIGHFPGVANEAGRVENPEANLISGVQLEQFEADIKSGAGNELAGKFMAIHSSTALAVNCFSPFKESPELLTCCGSSGFADVYFERICHTGLRGGTHPHLDVWLQREGEVIAIESKFTEYFAVSRAKYSDAYERKRFPHAEDCWWNVLEDSKTTEKQRLDVAQLVKHYLGLIRHLCTTSEMKTVTLLYLFWEPINSSEVDACIEHRQELANFAEKVTSSQISLTYQSYGSLWSEWSQTENLKQHVENLRRRYELEL